MDEEKKEYMMMKKKENKEDMHSSSFGMTINVKIDAPFDFIKQCEEGRNIISVWIL